MMGKCNAAVSQLFFLAKVTRDSRKELSLESIGQAVFVEQTFFFIITRGTLPKRSLLQFFEILMSDCIKCRFPVPTNTIYMPKKSGTADSLGKKRKRREICLIPEVGFSCYMQSRLCKLTGVYVPC